MHFCHSAAAASGVVLPGRLMPTDTDWVNDYTLELRILNLQLRSYAFLWTTSYLLLVFEESYSASAVLRTIRPTTIWIACGGERRKC